VFSIIRANYDFTAVRPNHSSSKFTLRPHRRFRGR
jgi:hypothetical protein